MSFYESAGDAAGTVAGAMAVVGGAMLVVDFASNTERQHADAWGKKYYDETVCKDIVQAVAEGRLEEKECPFPGGDNWTKGGIVKRHKFIFGALAICLLVDIITTVMGLSNDFGQGFEDLLGLIAFLLMFVFIAAAVVLIRKVFRGNKETYKQLYGEEGNKYWKVREYVRRALAMGHISQQDAVNQLTNTNLVQRLYTQRSGEGRYLGPKKSEEEWRADIFNYQLEHGLIPSQAQ